MEIRKVIALVVLLPILLAILLYGGGVIGQFVSGYLTWQQNGGIPGDGTSPPFPSFAVVDCVAAAFRFPYGLAGTLGCAVVLAVLFFSLLHGDSSGGELDRERNFHYSDKGTYGTSGFMSIREVKEVLDLTGSLKDHTGTVLGILNGKYVCVPHETRLNANMAVYGASGSMKTRSFCVNRILQSAARGESLIVCDPKSELYEKTSAYMRDKGYTVRVFNLVLPENSDSWNCLADIEGDELMAQLFCDVVIKNTGSTGGDHFWNAAEQNLLKALVLYVDLSYPENKQNIGEVYKLLTLSSENELNALFDVLPPTHPAKAPYTIFRQSSDTVRSGVIIGLGSRIQVFQNKKICDMTAYDEIDMELPGKQPCIYYCINSDQDSTFDFLASLFLSFVFIKLVRYADKNCPGGKLPVPVHVLGEELTACGVIPDLSRKISVIRSRNISMSCVFQNLAGLQNRYPLNQWQEILGNSDIQLFLGCVDELTARYISDRSGEVSIQVSSQAKSLGGSFARQSADYRETSGVGKRKLLTMDEVLRLPITQALVIVRGKKLLKVEKCDYTRHPEAEKLRDSKAAEHIPLWRANAEKEQQEKAEWKSQQAKEVREKKTVQAKPAEQKQPTQEEPLPQDKPVQQEEKQPSAPKQKGKPNIVPIDKKSIMSKE